MHHRLALLGTTLALSAPVVLAGASPVSAATYPSKVQKDYMKGCVGSAKKEGASAKTAKRYCKATLKCLQRELTLSEFKEFGEAIDAGDKTPPHNRVVKRCVKEAAKKL